MANQLSQGATSGMEGVVKKLGEKAGRPSGQSPARKSPRWKLN